MNNESGMPLSGNSLKAFFFNPKTNKCNEMEVLLTEVQVMADSLDPKEHNYSPRSKKFSSSGL